MPKLPIIKYKDLIKVLMKLGFYLHHQVGSHAQFKNRKGKRITIPIHSNRDIKPGTLKSILRDLEIPTEEFIKILHK